MPFYIIASKKVSFCGDGKEKHMTKIQWEMVYTCLLLMKSRTFKSSIFHQRQMIRMTQVGPEEVKVLRLTS